MFLSRPFSYQKVLEGHLGSFSSHWTTPTVSASLHSRGASALWSSLWPFSGPVLTGLSYIEGPRAGFSTSRGVSQEQRGRIISPYLFITLLLMQPISQCFLPFFGQHSWGIKCWENIWAFGSRFLLEPSSPPSSCFPPFAPLPSWFSAVEAE